MGVSVKEDCKVIIAQLDLLFTLQVEWNLEKERCINMGTKKINSILIVVSLALIVVFVGCLVYSFFNSEFSFVDTISAVSSFFVAVLTVITVYTTTRQMDFMKQQLDQMRDEQRMSEQPVLDVINPKFEIERPRFYHSPEGYSFQARYFFTLKINNLSSYPAIFSDVSAELIIDQGEKELVLGAVSCRLNVIAANTTSEVIDIMFAGDTRSRILSALRSLTTSSLPKLKLVITYKSLSGASYVLEHVYLLDIREDEDEQSLILKNWHTTITAAPVEDKETLEMLRKISSGEKKDEVFDLAKKAFDAKLAGGTALEVAMIEIPQRFALRSITDEQFNEMMKTHQYGRYVGNHMSECKMK